MTNFVRIVSYILMIGTTLVFVLKVKFIIPISYKQLIAVFILGVVSMFWANFRNNKVVKNK